MAVIQTTDTPFLQSKAQILVLPLSTDGNILNSVLARTKTIFAGHYDEYRKRTMTGDINLGDVLLHKVQKQQTGLSVDSRQVEYIASLMVQKFAEHPVSNRVLTQCLVSLRPMIYDLVRYKGIRRLAFFATPMLSGEPISKKQPSEFLQPITKEQIVLGWQTVFEDVPKLNIDLHFAKGILDDSKAR